MKYTAGIDLHSNNLFLAIIDEGGKSIIERKLPCELKRVLECLFPFKEGISCLAVESTFNWYWLVDGLMEAGYCVALANPAATGQYRGIKYTDDRHDARYLAELLRLDILPTGYIYDRRYRSVRDLLRRRIGLVKKQTSASLVIKSLYQRNTGQSLDLRPIKSGKDVALDALFPDVNDLLAAETQVNLLAELKRSIGAIEVQVLKNLPPHCPYKLLTTMPGIGKVLGLTIALETGDPSRFPTAGNFASYCRTVESRRVSNLKTKGRNNGKNGNRYLAWAFIEASNFARRYDEQARAYYDRKAARSHKIIATKTLACKLSKAAWHIMNEQCPYDAKKVYP